jgi:hypothetical protein
LCKEAHENQSEQASGWGFSIDDGSYGYVEQKDGEVREKIHEVELKSGEVVGWFSEMHLEGLEKVEAICVAQDYGAA